MRECLHITAHIDPRFGGLATSVPALAAAMNATNNCRSSVIAFCDGDETPPDNLGVPLETYPFGRLRWLTERGLSRRLEQRIRAAGSIHIHGIWQEHCRLAATLARKAEIPYVVSVHGMLEPWALRQKQWKKRLYALLSERQILNRAACLRALTDAEAGHYRAFGLTSPTAVIPNGIEMPGTPDPAPFWNQHPDLNGKRIALFLGRLHKKKGVEVLCHAWKHISASVPDTVLVFAGPDSDEAPGATANLVHSLGISGSVCLAGMLRGDQKWAALAAASLFVLPSFSEGFSVAILEALACATPVIITPACYFPDVPASQCGWIVEPEVHALATTLFDSLRLPPALLAAMGNNGVNLIHRQFQWPLIGRQMVDLHANLG